MNMLIEHVQMYTRNTIVRLVYRMATGGHLNMIIIAMNVVKIF